MKRITLTEDQAMAVLDAMLGEVFLGVRDEDGTEVTNPKSPILVATISGMLGLDAVPSMGSEVRPVVKVFSVIPDNAAERCAKLADILVCVGKRLGTAAEMVLLKKNEEPF